MEKQFKGPLFIVGLSRSGTKLIRDLLNRNTQICIPDEESVFLPTILSNSSLTTSETIERIQKSMFVHRFKDIQIPNIEELNKYADTSSKLGVVEATFKYYGIKGRNWNNNLIWGDKTPTYLRHIDLIKTHFPNLKVIHIIRDPRDRALSVKKTWGKSMCRATEKWRNEIEDSRKWEGQDFYYEVKYEDLVKETEKELKLICNFLNISFESKMLELMKPSEKHGQNSTKTKVNSSNINKFEQVDKNLLKRIEEIAFPMMKQLNYEPVYAKKFKRFSKFKMTFIKYIDYIKFRFSNLIKGY